MIDIFIHGTPNGHIVYSNKGLKDLYVESLYGMKLDDNTPSMIVKTKVIDQDIYCYYTYARRGILDKTGRLGGFFAITFRTNIFISCLKTVFNIFEILYEQTVLENIISREEQAHYIKESFMQDGKSVCKALTDMLSQIRMSEYGIALDDSFLENAGNPVFINPVDGASSDLMQRYKRAEKLILSPHVLTKREMLTQNRNLIDDKHRMKSEMERFHKLEVELHQKKEEVEKKEKELSDIRRRTIAENMALEAKKLQLEHEICICKNKIAELYETSNKMKTILKSIQGPLEILYNYASSV